MKLTMLSRDYCSLCAVMKKAISEYQRRFDFVLDVIEVDDFPELSEKYNELIPVLLDENGIEICHWHLDNQALENYFNRH